MGSAVYLQHRGEPIGPYLQTMLDRALDRTEARIAELREVRDRVRHFRAAHAGALAGQTNLELYASDPRRHAVGVAS